MAAHRHYGVVPICRVLQIAPSSVRSAMARPVCARRLQDDAVKPKLLEVFEANYRVYGRRKMKAALRREHGIDLDKDRIARLMRELGIRGATRTKSTVTTRSDKSSPRAPDLVNRHFAAARPNQLWVCDFTYVPTWSGFAYTAFVTDVRSRMIVGWRTASTMTADLVTDLSRWDDDHLEAVAAELNARPRKILSWRTPAEAFDEHLRSLQQTGVATTS